MYKERMVIEIRTLEADDLSFLNSVRNECRRFLHDDSKFTLEETREWFKTVYGNYYILEMNKQRIGYFRTNPQANRTIQIGADLHKDFRGKGYAKKAYRKFFGQLKKKGYDKCTLEVLASNLVAYNLYIKLGFCSVRVIDLLRN